MIAVESMRRIVFFLGFHFVQKVFMSRDVSSMNDFSSNLLKNR